MEFLSGTRFIKSSSAGNKDLHLILRQVLLLLLEVEVIFTRSNIKLHKYEFHGIVKWYYFGAT